MQLKNKQTEKETDIGRQIDKWRARQTDRKTGGQADRHDGRQTGRKEHIHIFYISIVEQLSSR